jgi:hypothetical protein
MTLLSAWRTSGIASPLSLAALIGLGWTLQTLGQQLSDEPATLQRALKVVNLKQFTRPAPDSMLYDQPADCHYTNKANFAATTAACKAELSSRGWKERGSISSNPPQYFDTMYEREGFLLRLVAYPSDSNRTVVSLTSLGNIEPSKLPRPEGFQPIDKPPLITCPGFVDANLDAAATSVRKVLRPQGWHERRDDDDPLAKQPELRSLHFRKNAVNVQVLVSRHIDGRTMVTYMLMPMASFDVPLPDDADALNVHEEIETGAGQASFHTGLDASHYTEFLKKAAAGLGWMDRTPKTAQNFRVFEDAEGWRYAASLKDSEEGGTQVQFDGVLVPKALRTASASVEAQPVEDQAAADKPVADKPVADKPADVSKENEVSRPSESIESKAMALIEALDPKRAESLRGTLSALGKNASGSASADQPPAAHVQSRSDSPAATPAGALAARDVRGLPIPQTSGNQSDESSPYRRALETSVSSTVAEVVAFYRREMPSRGYQETSESRVDADRATLVFQGNDSEVTASLKLAGNEVKLVLVDRHSAAAQKDRVVPVAGTARLLLASQAAADATVTINGAPYSVKAGTGAASPAKALKVDLFPGTNVLLVKLSGKADQTMEVPVMEGQTWGVVILDEGQVIGPLRFY